MLVATYTNSVSGKLNRLSIPDITEPVLIRVLWFHAASFDEKDTISNPDMHLHTFFEAHFVVNGATEYSDPESNTYRLTEGQGILISPCVRHRIQSNSSNLVKFSLAFLVDESSSFYSNLTKKDIDTFALSQALVDSIHAILQEVKRNTSFSPVLIRNRIFDIICEISRSLEIVEYCEPSAMEAEDDRVTSAKLFIADNSGRFFCCNEIANQCNLSSRQMDRLFLKYTGMSLHKYIIITKQKEVERLLSETQLPIKDIAEMTGFSSIYYFNRFFKKNSGVTPAAFRKMRK